MKEGAREGRERGKRKGGGRGKRKEVGRGKRKGGKSSELTLVILYIH